MKQFTRKSFGFAVGVALAAPWVLADAPSSVNGSLGGFSAGSQGGQDAAGWGIPDRGGGQNSSGQNSNGQNTAGQPGGKGPDAGGYGGQNGNGQNVPSQQGGKGPDAGGYGDQNGNGQNTQSSGQNGPGQQGGKGPDAGGYGDQNGNGQNGSGQGEHYNDGPTKNNSNNPDGSDSGHGEHYDDGPTKNNSNNPDGSDSGHGEHYDDGPTKNNSNNPDGDGGQGSRGNGNGNGSGSGSSGGNSGGNGGDYPPLDPASDGQYDPANNGGDQQIPSSCAEANSECGQCMQRNEAVLEFNRRYLHVAWSTTNKTLQYTKQAIAFGDGVSEMSKSSLSWQLTGKPQIIEAVQSLRATYDNKYRIYIGNMEQAMAAMTACENDNNAVQTLYRQFSGLYLDFIKARYASPD